MPTPLRSDNMVKILFLMDNITEGGAEKVLRTLVNNMDQSRFQITVQTVQEADAQKHLVPGVRYRAINRCRTAWGRKLFSLWLRLCAELNLIYPLYIRGDYDIEIAYLECGPTKFLSGSTNKKALKLAWVHCDLEQKGTVATKKLRNIYSRYDKVVCVSQNVKESYQRLFGNSPEAVVLHNVNDEEEILQKANAFSPEPADTFTFVSIGRLAHQKGYDRLLDACHMLKADGKNFRLLILGEGPERSALEAQILSLGLESRVQLLGFQENPYPYMKAADCIVCASRYEGFSTVITEALILGKPIVTTPCSGMDELLGNSEFGLVTEDNVQGIYNGMKKLLENEQLCRQYADAAALRGSAFSKASVLNQTQKFLTTELEQKRYSR